MTVPYILSSFYAKRETFAQMVAEFYSCNCHIFWWNHNYIQELFLLLEWRLHWGIFEWSYVNLMRHLLSFMSKKFTILELPCICVFNNIEFKSPDYLKIDKMNVNWMIVHCQINDVEIISPRLFKSSSCAAHFKSYIINLYCLWVSIRS